MADISDNSTASNYSIQPGSNHPPIASPIDPSDHPADNMPDMPWGASTSDAASGLAQARSDKKMSNNAKGNKMLNDRSFGTAFKGYQQATKAP